MSVADRHIRVVTGSLRRGDPPDTACWRFVAVAVASALLVAACSSTNRADSDGAPASTRSCPQTVDEHTFASADELRELSAEFAGFGLRSPGSDQHEASLDWLASQLSAVPGMKVDWDQFDIDRWQPTPAATGGAPGRDLAAAGGLSVDGGSGPTDVAVAGAVPFSLPTSSAGASGPLVSIPIDQPITAANAAGKVVVREIPHATVPYSAFRAIAHDLSPDIPADGDYDRPYLRPLDTALVDAGRAGAAALVLVWDAPTDQVRGYWDPHSGTRYRVPAVFIGNDQAPALEQEAGSGATARVVVRAAWDRAPTRNLIATLPGQSRERIVINSNTDGNTWVQDNGNVAAIALARYLGSLPIECRARDVQFALTTNHLGYANDGSYRYGDQLQHDVDDGTVAFVMAIEHLGTREILPTGPDGRLELTGAGELFAWSAPVESPTLVKASIDAVRRRHLDRVAVLQGVGAPVADQVPHICSQGGLGTTFHSRLVPTIAGISGPWSLWAPSFGADAIDFDRMRDQILAFGDVARALDDVPRESIAGDYLQERRARAGGAPTCDLTPPPAEAPAG